jgi:hypothetical protein
MTQGPDSYSQDYAYVDPNFIAVYHTTTAYSICKNILYIKKKSFPTFIVSPGQRSARLEE